MTIMMILIIIIIIIACKTYTAFLNSLICASAIMELERWQRVVGTRTCLCQRKFLLHICDIFSYIYLYSDFIFFVNYIILTNFMVTSWNRVFLKI